MHPRTQPEKLKMNISDLRQKAESGSLVAQAILGACYLDGIEVEVDYGEAFRLLSAAAGRGAPRAMVNLARMYSTGLGIPKDVAEGIRLYNAAAEAGEFLAQIELGRIYSRGMGVAADSAEALRWYLAAAAQEHGVAACEELQEAKDYVANAK